MKWESSLPRLAGDPWCVRGFDDGRPLRLFASSMGRCCWLCRSAELEDIFRHCGLMVTDFSAELARELLGDYINPPLRAFFVSGRVCSTLTVKSPLRHRTCRWMSLVSSWVCCRALIFAGLHGNIKWRHFKLSNLPWQFRNSKKLKSRSTNLAVRGPGEKNRIFKRPEAIF